MHNKKFDTNDTYPYDSHSASSITAILWYVLIRVNWFVLSVYVHIFWVMSEKR